MTTTVCVGAKMRAREMAIRPFWEGGEGRLLGDAGMPDGAEGVPEELMVMIRAAKGKRTRPGEPGRRKGMPLGTGMLMWKVPEAGEWQWDVLEVRAVVAQEDDSSQSTMTREGGRRGVGDSGGKAKRPRRR